MCRLEPGRGSGALCVCTASASPLPPLPPPSTPVAPTSAPTSDLPYPRREPLRFPALRLHGGLQSVPVAGSSVNLPRAPIHLSSITLLTKSRPTWGSPLGGTHSFDQSLWPGFIQHSHSSLSSWSVPGRREDTGMKLPLPSPVCGRVWRGCYLFTELTTAP